MPSVSADSTRPPAAGKRAREEPEVGMRGSKQHRLASPLKPPVGESRLGGSAEQVLQAPSPAAGEAWEEEIDLESELLAQLSESRHNSLLLPPPVPDSAAVLPDRSSRPGDAFEKIGEVQELREAKKTSKADPCVSADPASGRSSQLGSTRDRPAAAPIAAPRSEAIAQAEVLPPMPASAPSPLARPPKAAPQPALEDMSELDREFFGGAESSLWSDGEEI